MTAIQVVDDLILPTAGLRIGYRIPPRTPEGVAAAAASVAAYMLRGPAVPDAQALPELHV